MKQALLILLLVTIVLSKSFDSYVLTKDRKQQKEESKLNSSDLADVFKHNFGSLDQATETVKKFIESFSRVDTTVFNPVQANYLILISGENVDQEKIVGTTASKATLELDNNSNDSLFDKIFNMANEQSLVSTTSKFNKKGDKKEFYIFSQNKSFAQYFQNFGLSIFVNSQGKISIDDKQTNQVHNHKSESLEKCVNSAIGGEYRFNAAQQTISKKDNSEVITIDSTNATEINQFLTELCGVKLVSNLFKKDKSSFLLIEISTLPALQKVLSASNYAIAQNLVAQALNKVFNHYESHHKNKCYGQVIFTEQEKDNQFFISQESNKSSKPRVLSQVLTPEQVKEAQSYTLRSWFSIFFIALIFFVCYALFNVEISKDSLLYAKFIAEERR